MDPPLSSHWERGQALGIFTLVFRCNFSKQGGGGFSGEPQSPGDHDPASAQAIVLPLP